MGNDNMIDQWMVVVNPNAGRRKGKRDWKEISGLLESHSFNYTHVFTEGKYHAIEIAINAIENGYRRFIVVGGDGTMNEVVNGVFTQNNCSTSEIVIGMLTVGTGNDWGRMFNIPLDYNKALLTIKEGKEILQDAGVVHYNTDEGKKNRYFINIAGLGFDATVVKRTNNQKEKGRSSKTSYYWNLLMSLFTYKSTHTKVRVDGTEVKNDTFSISLGIGKYSGGGMMQTPDAMVDDGLFDITIIKRMRKGEIIRSLKKLYDGTILEHPKIDFYTGKSIEIISEPLIHVEADGESLGYSPIEFEIIPQSIKVIYNDITT